MLLRVLLSSVILLAGASPVWLATPLASGNETGPLACAGTHHTRWFGLLVKPLTVEEMVAQLERGCLALDEVRFLPGRDVVELVSPGRLAQVARALGKAQGAYRVIVPAEAEPGWPPDTVQARRRETRLRDELVYNGASLERLLEDGWEPRSPFGVASGAAKPMLVRVPGR